MDELARTSLIPFWARVADARRPDSILDDVDALALAIAVEAQYGRICVPDPVRVGCCLRNWLADQWIARLAATTDQLTVVTIGCGLDTRPQRLERLGCAYIEIDDDAIISARAQLMPSIGTNRFVGDGLDLDLWFDAVQPDAAVVVICEGVLVYQEQARVQAFFDDLARRFHSVYLAFDSLSPAAVRRGNAPKVRNDRPAYLWSAAQPATLIAGGSRLRVLENKGFLDLPYRFTRQFGLRSQLAHTLPPWRRSYRMTLANVGSGT